MKDVIIFIGKAMKAIRPAVINSCWRKVCPDVVHDLLGFIVEPVKELLKEIVDMAKKGGG